MVGPKLKLQLLVLALAAGTATGQVVLKGHLTSADTGQYKMLPFEVPAGTKRVSVELDFAPKDPETLLYLGIFDPIMYRGAGRPAFTISEYDATPPFSPGPIVPGNWNLLLGASNIPAGKPCDFTARVTFSNRDDKPAGVVIRSGSAWYKGDLHSHTGHSDGSCFSQSGKNIPCPAHKLIEAAAGRGLDFLAVTDHNTASTLNQIREMQPYFDKILLIHGREMTTFGGHANVWGTAEFLDYRIGYNGWTINDFLDQVHRAGGVISINHSYWPTGPKCPGCGWVWKPDTDFHRVDAMEAINGYSEKDGWYKPPPGNGVANWEEQVAKGFRVTAVGGGDDHRSGEQLYRGSAVGNPATVVYARELSEPAILEGIKAGHVIIQVKGPEGPALYLTSGTAIVGDNLTVAGKRDVEFQLKSGACAGCTATLLLDGKAAKTWPVQSELGTAYTLALDSGRHWVRAILESPAGELLTMTNPIYVNY